MTSYSTTHIETATISENGNFTNGRPRFVSTPQWIDKANIDKANQPSNQQNTTEKSRSTTAVAPDRNKEISLDGYYDSNRRPVSIGSAGASAGIRKKSETNSSQQMDNPKRIKSSGKENSLINPPPPPPPPPPSQESIASFHKRSSINPSFGSSISERSTRDKSDAGRQEVVIGEDLQQAIKQLLSIPTFIHDNKDEVPGQDMFDIMNNDGGDNVNFNRQQLAVGRERGASDSVFYEQKPKRTGNEDDKTTRVSIAVTVNDNGDSMKKCAVSVTSQPDDDVTIKVNRTSPGRVSEGWNIIHECDVGVIPSERYNSLSKSKEFWPRRVENVMKTVLLPAASQTENSIFQNEKNVDESPFRNEVNNEELSSQRIDSLTKTAVLPVESQPEKLPSLNSKRTNSNNSGTDFAPQQIKNVENTVLLPAASDTEKAKSVNTNYMKVELTNEELSSPSIENETKTHKLPVLDPKDKSDIIQNIKSVRSNTNKFELTNKECSSDRLESCSKTVTLSAFNKSTIENLNCASSNEKSVEQANEELLHHPVIIGDPPTKKDCSLSFKVNKVQKHSLAPKLVNIEPAEIESFNSNSSAFQNSNFAGARSTNETYNFTSSAIVSGNNNYETGDFKTSSDINSQIYEGAMEILERELIDERNDDLELKNDNEVIEKFLEEKGDNILISDDLNCTSSIPELNSNISEPISPNVRNISAFDDCMMQPESLNYEVSCFNCEKSPEELFDEVMESLRDNALSKIKLYSPKISAAIHDDVGIIEDKKEECDILTASLETGERAQLEPQTSDTEQYPVTLLSEVDRQSDIQRNLSIPEKHNLVARNESLTQPISVSNGYESSDRQLKGSSGNQSSNGNQNSRRNQSSSGYYHSSRLPNSSGCASDVYSDELDLDLENEFRTNLAACSNSNSDLDSGNLDDIFDPDDDDLFWESVDGRAKGTSDKLVVMSSADTPIDDVAMTSHESNTGVTSFDCHTTKTVNQNDVDSLNITLLQCYAIEPVENNLSFEQRGSAFLQSTSITSLDENTVIAEPVERLIAFKNQDKPLTSEASFSQSNIENFTLVDLNRNTLLEKNLVKSNNYDYEEYSDLELHQTDDHNDADDSMEQIVQENLKITSNSQMFSTIPQMSFNAIYQSNMSNALETPEIDRQAVRADDVNNLEIKNDQVRKSREYEFESELDNFYRGSTIYNDNIPDCLTMQFEAPLATSKDSLKTKNQILATYDDSLLATENILIADKANDNRVMVSKDSLPSNTGSIIANNDSLAASESSLTSENNSLIAGKHILAAKNDSQIDTKNYLIANENCLADNIENVSANVYSLSNNTDSIIAHKDSLRVNMDSLAAENDSMIVNIDSPNASLTSSSSNSSQSLVTTTTEEALNDHLALNDHHTTPVNTTGMVVLSDEVTTQEIVLAISWPNRKRASFSGPRSRRSAVAPGNSVEGKQPFRQLNVHRVIRLSDFDRDKIKRSRSSSVDSYKRLNSSQYVEDVNNSVVTTLDSNENDAQSKRTVQNSRETSSDKFGKSTSIISNSKSNLNSKSLTKPTVSFADDANPVQCLSSTDKASTVDFVSEKQFAQRTSEENDVTSSNVDQREENAAVHRVPAVSTYSVPHLNDVIDEITDFIRSDDTHSLNEAGILMTCRATESRSFPVAVGSMQESSVVNVIRRSILERKSSQS